MSNGQRVIAGLLTPPIRKKYETQAELECRIMDSMNKSQPNMVNKVVKVHLLRN